MLDLFFCFGTKGQFSEGRGASTGYLVMDRSVKFKPPQQMGTNEDGPCSEISLS